MQTRQRRKSGNVLKEARVSGWAEPNRAYTPNSWVHWKRPLKGDRPSKVRKLARGQGRKQLVENSPGKMKMSLKKVSTFSRHFGVTNRTQRQYEI